MGLLELLELAFAPALIARALKHVGLTAQDLADATGANVRTVSGWLDESRPEPKKRQHQDRLRDLKRVTRLIVDDGTISYQEADWLREPHGRADLKTPLKLISEDEWKQAGRLYCDDVAIAVPSLFASDEEIGAKERRRLERR
jgi:transposase